MNKQVLQGNPMRAILPRIPRLKKELASVRKKAQSV